MINGFEDYTYELTEYEQNVVLKLAVFVLKYARGKEKAITNQKAIREMKKIDESVKVDGPRFRKIVSFIRVNGLIPNLIATSKGYYITDDRDEMISYIESLDQRVNQIVRVRESMVRHFFSKND